MTMRMNVAARAMRTRTSSCQKTGISPKYQKKNTCILHFFASTRELYARSCHCSVQTEVCEAKKRKKGGRQDRSGPGQSFRG